MPNTARDLNLPVWSQPSLDPLVDVAVDADRLGYDRVWMPESWGRDAVTTLALVAERTEDVGIGTSIVNVYSRSPALLAQTAANLGEASDGRFRLGVGPSGPAVIENWHGQGYDRPLRRTRETIEIVRHALTGDIVDYEGDVFDLSGFRLRFAPPDPAPPVDAAAMGPKATELAGRFADGWHAYLLTRDGVRERLDDFARGTDLGGRTGSNQRVTLSVPCCALADGDRARELAARHVAFYVGAMGTFYRDSLARQGHETAAHAVHDAWQNGDRAAATAALPDDLLDDLVAAGTSEEARTALARFERIDGVDAVAATLPREATPEEVAETVANLSPD